MKRNEQHHEMAFVLIIMILVFIACGYFVLRVQAHEDNPAGSKLITVHTVRAGESLLSLAMDFSDPEHYPDYAAYIREVRFTNHLSEEDIHPGRQLFLPYYRER